jgi:NAD(P)-dependent dehydrogenase (short-subunit alcohol dehydrogenase family)
VSDHLQLLGCRALVTGGTQGIGAAVAALLRVAGVTVLTAARARPSDLTHTDRFVAADLSTDEGCPIVAGVVHDRLGGIDIMVHVVSGSSVPAGGFAALDDGQWHRALNQNLFPAVRLDRVLLPAMVE